MVQSQSNITGKARTKDPGKPVIEKEEKRVVKTKEFKGKYNTKKWQA